jgi:hypothetical protein
MGLVQRLVRGAGYFVGESAKPLSGRYLSFAEREEIALLRAQRYTIQESLAGSDGHRRQSPGSCGATPPPETAAWSIARRQRNGTPSEPLAAQSRRSLRSTRHCKPMWRNDWLASSSLQAGLLFPAPPCPGKAVGMDRGKTGGGQPPGARSRSPAACRSTFRTMRPCASALLDRERPHHTMRPGPAADSRSRPIGDRTHEAARVLRRRAIAPGRPRTFMIRPVVS